MRGSLTSHSARLRPMDELFSTVNITGLAGASAAAVVAGNTFRVFGVPPKLTALAASFVIAFTVLAMRQEPLQWLDWVLAFFNGCLIFCTATGMNETTATRTAAPPGKGFAGAKKGAPFFGSWFVASGDGKPVST